MAAASAAGMMPASGEHGGVGAAALDVLAPHLAVEGDRVVDILHDGGPAAKRPPHWELLDTMAALSGLHASRRVMVLAAAGTLAGAVAGRKALGAGSAQ